jgi:hypothetical protein
VGALTQGSNPGYDTICAVGYSSTAKEKKIELALIHFAVYLCQNLVCSTKHII